MSKLGDYEFVRMLVCSDVRMAEWSKALRSGRSPLLRAWVRIPLLTIYFPVNLILIRHILNKFGPISAEDSALDF